MPKEKSDAKLVICTNRKARHDYELGEKIEAGLVLHGTEVKSCRNGKAQLQDAYVRIDRGEAYLVGMHISEYVNGGYQNHAVGRPRKLLLHKGELLRMARKIEDKGAVAIPLSLYFKNGYVKAEIAMASGKKKFDRREDIKERDTKREIDRAMKGAKARGRK